MTNSRQKKVKTIKASDLNSPDISAGVFRIFAQFKNGLMQKKINNTIAIIIINIA
jgi:hypothetical protein